MPKDELYDSFREVKCDFCGKTFLITPQWVYKRLYQETVQRKDGTIDKEQMLKRYCKYTCLTADERRHKGDRRYHKIV